MSSIQYANNWTRRFLKIHKYQKSPFISSNKARHYKISVLTDKNPNCTYQCLLGIMIYNDTNIIFNISLRPNFCHLNVMRNRTISLQKQSYTKTLAETWETLRNNSLEHLHI